MPAKLTPVLNAEVLLHVFESQVLCIGLHSLSLLYLRLNPAFNQALPQSQWELQFLMQIQQDGVMKADLASTALTHAEGPSFT